MLRCKNALEYETELGRLRDGFFEENHLLWQRFPIPDNNHEVIPRHKEREKERRGIAIKWRKIIDDFENSQPIKPLYVYKTRRKFYEIRYLEKEPFLWISAEPVQEQTLREKTYAWVLPIHFGSTAVNVVDCFHCNRPFIRDYPHQKYCLTCQIDRNVILRNCLYCGKPLPYNRHGKAKYCKGGACRQAAYRDRKKND